MTDNSTTEYSTLDRPEVLMVLFHPRPEWGESRDRSPATDMLIPVAKEVVDRSPVPYGCQHCPQHPFLSRKW